MALNGTIIGSTYASGYRLEITWSATQSIANNQSTITAEVYWRSLGSSYTISSSSTKSGTTTIDGTTQSFSGSGLANLSGNQRKLINTYKRTITHANNGTKTATLTATFDADIPGLLGTVTVSGSADLDDIPRASTLSSNKSWIAPDPLPITINRASSSFSHTIRVYVKDAGGTDRLITTVTGVGHGGTIFFSEAENTNIFNRLAQANSRISRIDLETYDGSTFIGSNTYNGNCYAPTVSTVALPDFDIGDNPIASISRANTNFKHTVRFTFGSFEKVFNDVSTGQAMNFDVAEINTLYNQIPNNNSGVGGIHCTTYYNGVQIKSSTSSTFRAYVKNSNPIFTADFIYRDIEASTLAITNNSQLIVRNKSSAIVEIHTDVKATARNGASMVKYIVTINGVQIAKNWSSSATVSFPFGLINASSDTQITIVAEDSRGNRTTVSKTMLILDHIEPNLIVSLSRLYSFERETTLKVSGDFSPLLIDQQINNALLQLQYRYIGNEDSNWTEWFDLTPTLNGNSFQAPDEILDLDNLMSFNVQIKAVDKLSERVATRSVSVGIPMMAMDSVKKSYGFNKFPSGVGTFEFDGDFIGDNTIVEMGSNANGSYVKWANGLQICYKRFAIISTATTSGQMHRTDVQSWTLPVTFDTNYERVVTASADGEAYCSVTEIDGTSLTYRNLRPVTGGTRAYIQVIGRWK